MPTTYAVTYRDPFEDCSEIFVKVTCEDGLKDGFENFISLVSGRNGFDILSFKEMERESRFFSPLSETMFLSPRMLFKEREEDSKVAMLDKDLIDQAGPEFIKHLCKRWKEGGADLKVTARVRRYVKRK